MNIKVINEIFNILICTKPWEFDKYFYIYSSSQLRLATLQVFNSHMRLVAAMLEKPRRIPLVLPATWNKFVLMDDSELGVLDLSFSICEVRVILPVLLTSQGSLKVKYPEHSHF